MQRDPNKRPTAAELLSHQYLTQMSATKQHSSDDSKKANSSNESQSNIRPELLSQISNLTPNSLKCFSKVYYRFFNKIKLPISHCRYWNHFRKSLKLYGIYTSSSFGYFVIIIFSFFFINLIDSSTSKMK